MTTRAWIFAATLMVVTLAVVTVGRVNTMHADLQVNTAEAGPYRVLAQLDAAQPKTHSEKVADVMKAGKSDAPPTPSDDLGKFANNVYKYLTSSRWLALTGAAFVLLVWLAAKFWEVKTKGGKYLLAFGSAMLLYVGAAWQAPDASWTNLSVYTTALGMAWAASGGLETFTDIVSWWRARRESA